MFFHKFHRDKSDGKEKMPDQRKYFLEREREMVCTVSGNREVWIENYGSLGDFSEEKVILNGYRCRMIVEGERLGIEYFTDVDMKITGRIRAIRFL